MSEFTEYAPGTFCYLDVHTTDPDTAIAFYERLFGLESETADVPGGGRYTQFHKDGKWVFGLNELSPRQREMGMPSMWISHVAVADADDARARVVAAGGTTLLSPTEVPGTGRFAMYADPHGAVFATWEDRGFPGSQLANEHGTLIWNELMTPDVATAAAFYGKVFGWEARVSEMPTGPYTVFTDGEEMRAGAMAITPEMGEMPASWGVYFDVADFENAFASAKNLGATAETEPITVEGVGTFAVLRDPTGAHFSIMESAPQE